MKQNLINNSVWIFFLGIGLIFAALCISGLGDTFNYDNKIETVGIITRITSYRDSDGDLSHSVYVSYNVRGSNYESQLDGYSSLFYEGKKIDIYYDQNDPTKIGAKSLDLIFLIFPSMSLLLLIIGATGLTINIRKNILEKKLKKSGMTIYATYVETVRNTSYKVNGKQPYNIICEWLNPSDNQKYIFKSKNIWQNPENAISERNIQKFPVYIDPNNMKKYAVEVASITK